MYCGGSCIYGTLKYEDCHFINCTPIAYGYEYKTLVGANEIIKNCIFDVTKKCYSILTTTLNTNMNPRQSLAQKNFPNIDIDGLQINVPNGIENVYLYYTNKTTYEGTVGYISSIKLRHLVLNCEDELHPAKFTLCNKLINTDDAISIDIRSTQLGHSPLNYRVSSTRENRVSIRRSSFCEAEGVMEGVEVTAKRCQIYKHYL